MATLMEAMDAIETEFDTYKTANNVADAVALRNDIVAWLDEFVADIYQKSIGADNAGIAADVTDRRADLDARIGP